MPEGAEDDVTNAESGGGGGPPDCVAHCNWDNDDCPQDCDTSSCPEEGGTPKSAIDAYIAGGCSGGDDDTDHHGGDNAAVYTGANDGKATIANAATDISAHDASRCREGTEDDLDDDCCGFGNEIWCADDFWMVVGYESNNDCWPGGKGYKCLPPPAECPTTFSVEVVNPTEIQERPTTHEEGNHFGESDDAKDAWSGKQIMYESPTSYDVQYKVTFTTTTTVFGLIAKYDAGATLKWRKEGGDNTWYSHDCYSTNGDAESYCNVPANTGVSGTGFEVVIDSHHTEWNWFGSLEFVCSPMPEGAENDMRTDSIHATDSIHEDYSASYPCDTVEDCEIYCEAGKLPNCEDQAGKHDFCLPKNEPKNETCVKNLFRCSLSRKQCEANSDDTWSGFLAASSRMHLNISIVVAMAFAVVASMK
jgi:hypothetical protein